MPVLELKDAEIYYELSGLEQETVLVLSNSLGTNLAMWEPQMPALSQAFRILRYDTRGHGRSSVSPGPYTIEQLANEVLALLDKLRIERVHFCGLSMGGMIGMSLAVRVSHRLRKLILCNTAPKIGSPEVWNTRIDTVRKNGMKAVADGVLERWFTPAFRAASPSAIESTKQMLLTTPVEGYAASCAAVRDMDARDSISSIRVPTLIIGGTHDPVTPPHDGHFMAERIAGAGYQELPAAHLSNIEASAAFTMAVSSFLRG
ncbi:MAG: 3-oxoadipate enol-lactonase [Terriglobales bacterium]